MDFNKLSAIKKLTTQALNYVRHGLSLEYIDAKLIESRNTLVSIDDIKRIEEKCLRYQRPDFSVSLSEQPRYIIFADTDEFERFQKVYRSALSHIGCSCSFDNLTMTL